MGCGDIGTKLVKEGVKYGVEIVIEKCGEAVGLPKPVAKGVATIVGLFLG